MFFSVIIPVYNVEKFLQKCLDSVIEQKFSDFEIIIVDDASPDNSRAIYQDYARKDNRIKIIQHQKNKRQGAARNSAIKNAKGTWLLFLDGDDLLAKNALEIFFQHLKQNENYDSIDVCLGKRLFFTGQKYWQPRYLDNIYQQHRLTGLTESPLVLQDIYVCNKIWRKEFLQKHQLRFRENCFYEDIDFYITSLALARRFLILSNTVVLVRRYRQGSTTTVRRADNLEFLLRGYDAALAQLRRLELDDDGVVRVIIERLLLCFVKPMVIPAFYIAEKNSASRRQYHTLLKSRAQDYWRQLRYLQKNRLKYRKDKQSYRQGERQKTSFNISLRFLFVVVYHLPWPVFDIFCRCYIGFYEFIFGVFVRFGAGGRTRTGME